jgi:Ca-activated chloride channel homolog
MNQNTRSQPNAIPSEPPMEPWMLSAYALGELETDDSLRVSQALASNADLRNELKQIQRTIGVVQSVLAQSNSNASLKSEQVHVLNQHFANRAPVQQPSHAPKLAWYQNRGVVGLLAVAAAAVPISLIAFPSVWMREKDIATKEASQGKVTGTVSMLPHSVEISDPALPITNTASESQLEDVKTELETAVREQIAMSGDILSDQKKSWELESERDGLKDSVFIDPSTSPGHSYREQGGATGNDHEFAMPDSSKHVELDSPHDKSVESTAKEHLSQVVPSADDQENRKRQDGKQGDGKQGDGKQSDGRQSDAKPGKGRQSGGSTGGMGSGGMGSSLGSSAGPSPAPSASPAFTADDLTTNVLGNEEQIPMAGGLGGSGSGGMGPGGIGLGGLGSSESGPRGLAKGGMGSGEMGMGSGPGGGGRSGVKASTESMSDHSSPPAPLPEGEQKLKSILVDDMALSVGERRLKFQPSDASSASAKGGKSLNEPMQQLGIPLELSKNVSGRELFRSNETLQGDRFAPIVETPFASPIQAPLSTFSVDVDTASYSKIRQVLTQQGSLPSPNMVRIEEMINYFEYNYASPADNSPFAASMMMETCRWNREHKLVRIGLQARKLDRNARPKANLVFLLDVSGSMNEPNKLPLVKKTLSLLAEQLTENDRVAIVVYAGAAGCVLPSINGSQKQTILSALDHLNAGGSTNGGQGIQLAYSIAKQNFVSGGVNRVILCTDGDFNVGVTGDDALVEMMQENAKSNIFLTCLGYGSGNYNDSMMEKISNKGNGIYGMIDSEMEARRMMVEQLQGTLVTVAKDVKIQVDFNPNLVESYRLIGYEDRKLAARDFNDDKKDAGEIGAGHRVTALYEIVPKGVAANQLPSEDGETSKYAPNTALKTPNELLRAEGRELTGFSDEILTLKVRYKEPEGSVSSKQEFVLKQSDQDRQPEIDRDMQWASAVAEFGLLLRRSSMAPHADWRAMIERAEGATLGDAYRIECVQMMRSAARLNGRSE